MYNFLINKIFNRHKEKSARKKLANNPFSHYGNIVEPNNFIGRKNEIKTIKNSILNFNSGNIAIVGLSRIGKSSLVYNTLDIEKDNLFSDRTIYFRQNFGIYNNFGEFCFELLSFIKKEIEQLSESKLYQKFAEFEESLESSREISIKRNIIIKNAFQILKSNNIRVICALDEFDHAKRILKLQDFQFLREWGVNPEYNISLVTCSRREIRKLEPLNGELSNFYQIFNNIYLMPFNKDEMEEYWNKFYISNDFALTDEIKKKIIFYSGSFPYFLDLFGSKFINSNLILDNCKTDIEYDIKQCYEQLLKFLESDYNNDYKLKIRQILFGPNIDIKQSDIDFFLRMGIIKESTISYDPLSDFFKDYIEDLSREGKISDLWTKTEKNLRDLATKVLTESFGDLWEEGYRKAFPEHMSTDKGVHIIDRLIVKRDHDIKKWGKKARMNLILQTYPLELMMIMNKNWPKLEKIFELRKINKIEFNRIMSFLSTIRTPIAHSKDFIVPDSEKNIFTGYCDKINYCIENQSG